MPSFSFDAFVNRAMSLPDAVLMRLRILRLRLLGVQIQGCCWVQNIEIRRNPWDISITSAGLDDHVVLFTTGSRRREPRIVIGEKAYINRFTILDATERIEIGSGAMIGPQCFITDHDHGTRPEMKINEQPLCGAPVRIGEGAWLGAQVVVLQGVTIGDGAVVGAGSVVNKDVPVNAIAVGVPARVVRFR